MIIIERRRKIALFIGAIVLAAIIVVLVLLWLSGSLFTPDTKTPTELDIQVIESTPTPVATPVARITPEAATSGQVAGVTTTAPTGPAENALAAALLASGLGLGGSLFFARKLS